jgi:hypothetical protein
MRVNIKNLIHKYKQKNQLQTIHFDRNKKVLVTLFSMAEQPRQSALNEQESNIFTTRILDDINYFSREYKKCIFNLQIKLTELINTLIENDAILATLNFTEKQLTWRMLQHTLLINLIISLEKLTQRQSNKDKLELTLSSVKENMNVFYHNILSDEQKHSLQPEKQIVTDFISECECAQNYYNSGEQSRTLGLGNEYNTTTHQDETNRALPNTVSTRRSLKQLRQKINKKNIAACIILGIALSSLIIILTHGIILPPLLAAGIEVFDCALIVGLSGIGGAIVGKIKSHLQAGKRSQTLTHERSDYVSIIHQRGLFSQADEIRTEDVSEKNLLNAETQTNVMV